MGLNHDLETVVGIGKQTTSAIVSRILEISKINVFKNAFKVDSPKFYYLNMYKWRKCVFTCI